MTEQGGGPQGDGEEGVQLRDGGPAGAHRGPSSSVKLVPLAPPRSLAGPSTGGQIQSPVPKSPKRKEMEGATKETKGGPEMPPPQRPIGAGRGLQKSVHQKPVMPVPKIRSAVQLTSKNVAKTPGMMTTRDHTRISKEL